MPERYHLFVDETGQHTRGDYFLVCALAVPTANLDRLRDEVSSVEARIGSPWRKWVHSTVSRKRRYLEEARELASGLAPVCYRNHHGGTDYISWTGQLIAAAILGRAPAAQVTVIVDGYNANECQAIQGALKAHSVRWAKVRGARDESEPLLRLVDSLTGYLGDAHRSKPYTEPYRPLWDRILKPL